MLRLAGFFCEKCNKSQSDGAILQVHHKEYILGKAAWDYDYSLCEVLCKGCHARRHGRIMPLEGWVCVGDDDLGSLSGECDRCGTSLRYEFYITHPLWYDMTVGTDCCDELTGTKEASDKKRLIERRKSFCDKSRWSVLKEKHSRNFKSVSVDIVRADDGFSIVANGQLGRMKFGDLLAAKIHVHGLFEGGELKAYLKQARDKKALTIS